MEANNIWATVEDMLDTTILPEWLQSADVLSILFFVTGVLLFYLVLNVALKAISLLFWPTAIIVGLLYFQNETFAASLSDSVVQIADNFRGGCVYRYDVN